ncbi:MAG: exodeoxyribonuclease VII large subunit [Clostridia bacterium]|nr:exodeoxyribonuclease VII large subunit [Clostridia bacterium]
MANKPITVTALSEYIKDMLDSDVLLQKVYVVGELSNFKVHSSGHCYFSLKDEGAVINAVMFRGDAAKLRFHPESGMKVILYGRVSLFPKSGQYQIYVSNMQPDGVGSLYVAFEQLKEKLYKEGLFDKKYKKPLPRYPQKIGLVTSPTGAAVRDMIRIIGSRYKAAEIIVCPVLVQGDTAADSIANMIKYVNEHQLCDVIICGRGGGSIEDLWCFNDEKVARAVFESRIPVISAVGHEPDITIIDYVADVRASTPSNGAEIIVPDSSLILMRLNDIKQKLYMMEHKKIGFLKEKLAMLENNKLMRSPMSYFADKNMMLGMQEQKLVNAAEKLMQSKKNEYVRLVSMLDALSPLKVISRGYGMVESDGRIVKSIDDIKTDSVIKTSLSDGWFESVVTKIEEKK